jgi:hypothetical protein
MHPTILMARTANLITEENSNVNLNIFKRVKLFDLQSAESSLNFLVLSGNSCGCVRTDKPASRVKLIKI